MSLSSLQLDAFFELAKTKVFSKAAKNLHLTQPAFSQRILNLEKEIGVSLFVRQPTGAQLTEAGNKLLRYCQTRIGLEREFLGTLSPPRKGELSGEIRIGGYSSIFRSLIVPAMADLIRKNARVRIETFVRETHELPDLLRSCQIDFAILDQQPERQGIESHFLGNEFYVLVESRIANARQSTFLDHDPDDRITELFFKQQKYFPNSFERSFMDDIYGIISGVELGWGQAVLPRHLIDGNRKIKIVAGLKDLRMPIYLTYHTQPYYTELHRAVVAAIISGCDVALSSK